jgi:hypothetical protein
MGEKIRDIKKIKIGNSSLMVELNEGYSASQGRLIHIQNEKFRYLLTEIDFYHLSSMIMRAWSELDYLKHQSVIIKREEDFSDKNQNNTELDSVFQVIANSLNRNAINYRLIDKCGSTISVLVDKKQLKLLDSLMVEMDYKKTSHPMGMKNGFRFLYQMHPFVMYKKNLFNIEFFCELPCRSITTKTWIPLDRAIQAVAWGNSDSKDGINWCEAKSRYIYILCKSIFSDNGFSSHSRAILLELSYVLKDDSFVSLLSAVFFKYSHVIIEKLLNKDFDSIIPDYYTFKNY